MSTQLEKLRNWKKQNRYTIKEIAEMLDYNEGHLGKVFSGHPYTDGKPSEPSPAFIGRFWQRFPDDAVAIFRE